MSTKNKKTLKCKSHREKHWKKWQSFHSYRSTLENKKRFLWLRFIPFFLFLIISLLIVGGFMGAMYRTERFMPSMRPHSEASMLICLVPIFIVAIIIFFGMRAFRNMGNPLANIMTAADTVASGDFSVRVPVNGPGEMQKLSKSFNRMVEELASADQQRRNMTADIAHELRTPLHILRGNLEGLLDGVYKATPNQIESMLYETQLLVRLVNDLQTISLAEAGQLPLTITNVNVAELLADVQTSFILQAEEAGVKLLIDIEDESLSINVDAGRLDQVLGNLVANALRYTSADDSIYLKANSNSEGVCILVADEGQGINPEDVPFIFDRFYRRDKSRSREEGGSGLGLTIARQLIQLHNGTIKVESELEKGTTFIINLPL